MRGGRPLTLPQGVLPQNWGGNGAKSYCHLYGVQGFGQRQAPCHDEFRRARSDYVRQMALATTSTQVTYNIVN
ncbi:hypothetical protein TNCV_420691 [Trichonephila clavipes]|nr:hypothetical protein TNCV_420691 [Trichonephila clavipes]